MITKKEIFVTSDQSRFDTFEEARDYETLWLAVEGIMIHLPPKPDWNDPIWGDINAWAREEYLDAGYLQHDTDVYWQVRNSLMDLMMVHLPDLKKTFEPVYGNDGYDPSWVARGVEGNGPFEQAWRRFMDIDPITCREYQQPAFAISNWKESFKKKYGDLL